ncbi:N-acetyl-gamma-glutamyl-phosphate reductase, partial [Vibrio parahaemolyticus VPTS-2010]
QVVSLAQGVKPQ